MIFSATRSPHFRKQLSDLDHNIRAGLLKPDGFFLGYIIKVQFTEQELVSALFAAIEGGHYRLVLILTTLGVPPKEIKVKNQGVDALLFTIMLQERYNALFCILQTLESAPKESIKTTQDQCGETLKRFIKIDELLNALIHPQHYQRRAPSPPNAFVPGFAIHTNKQPVDQIEEHKERDLEMGLPHDQRIKVELD
jgi:hypothetical protein